MARALSSPGVRASILSFARLFAKGGLVPTPVYHKHLSMAFQLSFNPYRYSGAAGFKAHLRVWRFMAKSCGAVPQADLRKPRPHNGFKKALTV